LFSQIRHGLKSESFEFDILVFAGDPDPVVKGVVNGGNLSLIRDDSMRENNVTFLPKISFTNNFIIIIMEKAFVLYKKDDFL
jgi:hypothetical protein